MRRLRIVISFCCAALLLLAPLKVRAEEAAKAPEAKELTGLCTYTLPTAVPVERLTDESLLTRLTVSRSRKLTVELPEGSEAPVLYLSWFRQPPVLTLKQFDGSGKLLSESQPALGYPMGLVPLDSGCRKAELSSEDSWTISTLRVFDGAVPEALPHFEGTMDQAQVLVLLGQPQALFEELGGLLPLYIEQGAKVAVCYLSEDSQVLQATAGDPRPLGEAVTALWSLGYREAPIIGGFVDRDYNELEDVQKTWTDKALCAYAADLIRTLRPDTVICASGGEGDQRSAYVASQLENILLQAGAENSKGPAAFAPEQVLLSDPEGATVVSYEGAREETREAYGLLFSRQVYRKTLPQEGHFRLVGQADKALTLFAPTAAAAQITPEPTEEPTPEPSQEPTAEPTEAPTPSPTPMQTPIPTAVPEEPTWLESNSRRLQKLCVLVMGLGAVLCISMWMLPKDRSTKAYRTPLMVTGAAVVLLGIGGLVLISYLGSHPLVRQTAQLEAAQTFTPAPAQQSPVPTPAATESPAPSNTPEPTAEPTPDPYPFLPYGEKEQVEVFDFEKGRWVYRSDTLTVDVTRKTTEVDKGPVTYFAAHVYTRDVDSFYSTFASNRKDGRTRTWPQEMANRYKSVIWFTGDNLIQAEAEAKGVLIRDGRVYSKTRASHSLAYYSESQAFAIVNKSAMDAITLWESGTQDVFSFPRGSDLVIDGEISKGASNTTQRNPRCALGMVEPGHYVVVVADGRQPGYSVGFKLIELAQVFVDEGCTLAYNLDGGISTSLFFLGVKLNHHGDEAGTGGIVDYQQRSLPEGLAWGMSDLCGTLDK